MRLRDYQAAIMADISAASSHDIVQLDTGAGKTPIIAALAQQAQHCIVVAHRNVLLEQASEKLAAFGVDHDVAASNHTRRRCAAAHRRQHGRIHVRRGERRCIVASIDTLASRMRRNAMGLDASTPWLIVIDEAHHVVAENKWGALREAFPAARFVGFTGTPARLDGKSLHADHGGLFTRLVQAPELRQDSILTLVRMGHLCPTRVCSPPGALRRLGSCELEIVGDPVECYMRLAAGRQAVAMCPSIRNAQELAEQMRAAGVPAACISSEMSASSVAHVLDLYSARRVMVLCNVDMVGEGFDLPSVEVLIMLRRTASFVAYRQWVGRTRRPAEGKDAALIIDHVGNVIQHELPDEHVTWDLLEPPRGMGLLKQAPCSACGMWYPVDERRCPECGEPNALLERGAIGGHYVNLRERIDMALVHQAQQQIDRETLEEAMRTRIIWPASLSSVRPGLIGAAVCKLRHWFVARVESAGVSPSDINAFLRSDAAAGDAFFIRQFTIADLSDTTTAKALKAFRKWQKSGLSAATPRSTRAQRT